MVIFGSSFPHDQEYTQICANINRIKIAMALGQTVVLCNLNNLYESLYDALNQNYLVQGGKRLDYLNWAFTIKLDLFCSAVVSKGTDLDFLQVR